MKLTAELSLYPLHEDYIPIIRDFIDAMGQHAGITIVTNAMSTQLCGDYDQLFPLIQQELKASYQRSGKQVLVCKFIVGDLGIDK